MDPGSDVEQSDWSNKREVGDACFPLSHSIWYVTAFFRRFTRSGFTLGLYAVALRCGFTPWFYAVAEGVGSVFAPAPASK